MKDHFIKDGLRENQASEVNYWKVGPHDIKWPG